MMTNDDEKKMKKQMMLTGEETKKEEDVENQDRLQFSTLPDVVLKHLAPFLIWTSRRSLSQVNRRFRPHFSSLLGNGQSLSIKGNVSVGVGENCDEQNTVSLFEFYLVHLQMGEDMNVYWKMETESGVRTVVYRQYDGKREVEKKTSVMVPSRKYLERILTWILSRFHFDKIHLGVPGLASLFDNYTHRVEDVGISNQVDYLLLAERLRPRKLAVSQVAHNNPQRGTFDLTKFPQLEQLMLYGVPLDLDQFVDSKLTKVTADTIKNPIRVRHANKVIQNWKSGAVKYKRIRITTEQPQIPIKVPHQHWTELHDEREDSDVFYDDVENKDRQVGSFRYSPKSFEFVSWAENGGKEPSCW